MLPIAQVVMVSDHNIKTIRFGNLDFLALKSETLHK